MVRLDIISDPICPWCYIGKANLDRALERNPDHPFVIEWHPFQLNPDMPRTGADRREYLVAKFGSTAAYDQANARLVQVATQAGVEINLDKNTRIPNTLDAHRLIHWAGLEQRQTPVVTALFRANFVEGRDLSDAEVLCDIADSAGLDAAVIGRLLASDADRDELLRREAHSRQMGVTAVPTFVVASQHAVPGAQPPELWDRVITDIRAQLTAP
jgi:predicted DsbA family dithiol-disulfide isomerase